MSSIKRWTKFDGESASMYRGVQIRHGQKLMRSKLGEL